MYILGFLAITYSPITSTTTRRVRGPSSSTSNMCCHVPLTKRLFFTGKTRVEPINDTAKCACALLSILLCIHECPGLKISLIRLRRSLIRPASFSFATRPAVACGRCTRQKPLFMPLSATIRSTSPVISTTSSL